MSRSPRQPAAGDDPAAAEPAPGGAAGHRPAAGDSAADHPEPEASQEDSPPAPVPLLEPRDGLPPLIGTAEALRDATRSLAAGHGPVAVDAEDRKSVV